MFRLILEGKIGEYLAPIVASNKLFLAIQHHDNGNIENLIAANPSDMTNLADGGIAAIHVACRYNNRYALDVIMSKGVSVEFLDTQGNTPLHYAAKYGHLDLCKLLIDRGCPPSKENVGRQKAYDVSENHVVRQYLLPLLFHGENSSDHWQQQPDAYNYTYNNSQIPNYNQYSMPNSVQVSPPSPSHRLQQLQSNQQTAPLVVPAFQPPQFNSCRPVQVDSDHIHQPPMVHQPQGHNTPALPLPVCPPIPSSTSSSSFPISTTATTVSSSSGGNYSSSSSSSSNTSRTIRPDGFHSSASDPELQAKYGHVKAVINIAPPPTGAGFSHSAAPGSGSAMPLNKYVAYDPMNSAPPNAQSSYTQHSSLISGNNYTATAGGFNTMPPSAVPVQHQQPPTHQQQPQLSLSAPPQIINNTGFTPPGFQGSSPFGKSPVPGPGAAALGSVQTVAGNAPLASSKYQSSGPISGLGIAQPNTWGASRGVAGIEHKNINVFNPATDCDVVVADASSSSVM